MTEPWMDHPKLVAWFDDLEDAVTTALALTAEQRAEVRARKAPRAATWVMLARDTATRDAMRERLAQARHHLPVAHDCWALEPPAGVFPDEDTFERPYAGREVDSSIL